MPGTAVHYRQNACMQGEGNSMNRRLLLFVDYIHFGFVQHRNTGDRIEGTSVAS